MAVGIGQGTDEDFLKMTIASSQDDYVEADNFEELITYVDDLSELVCSGKVPATC